MSMGDLQPGPLKEWVARIVIGSELPDGAEDGKQVLDDRKDALKTYVEQTKLLVTLASAFVVAPAALMAAYKAGVSFPFTLWQLRGFVFAEVMFILSVLMGYVVLATIAGSQYDGDHDVYRGATRVSSILQILTYLLGLATFILLFYLMVTAILEAPKT